MDQIPDNTRPNGPARNGNGLVWDSPLQDYGAILLREKWTLILTFVLVFGLTAVYTYRLNPVYEASSLVLVEEKGNQAAIRVFDFSGTGATNKITNEIEILKSNAMVRAVAQALLERKYVDDGKTRLLSIIEGDVKQNSQDSTAPVSVIADRVAQAVDFSPVRESDVIRISARSTRPAEAAVIANVYTDVYTTRNLTTSRLRSKSLREFLQSQVHSKREVLDSAENQLQTYMRASGVVSLDAEANKVVDQLSQLEAQRDALEVEKSTRSKMVDSYKKEVALQQPNAAKVIGEANDSYIRLLQEQLAKLEVQRDVVVAQNPGMTDEKIYSQKLDEIDGQINSLKKRLTERTEQYLSSLLPASQQVSGGTTSFLADYKQKIVEQQIELGGIDARIKALNVVIGDYERKFNQIPRKSIELAKLQRARLSNEKLYLLVTEKYEEAAIQEKSEFGYVNIVDPAVVPINKVSPRIFLNLFLGSLAGLALGVGLVFVKAFADTRVRTPEDLKRLGLTPLTSISVMDAEVKKIRKELESGDESRMFDPHLIPLHRPLSPVSESYRHLRTTLSRRNDSPPLRCVVVTSPGAQEGKSTTAANLAIVYAQGGSKVLLVDADMRRSSIHALFGTSRTVGLSEYLRGSAGLGEIIQKNVLTNLDIIVCGAIPPNPAEILASKQMKEFLGSVREIYTLVILDAPPILAVTDAAVLATESDGTIMVAASAETNARALRSVAEYGGEIRANFLGVVLNKFDVRNEYGKYYSGYHYGYYGYESGYYDNDLKRKSESPW